MLLKLPLVSDKLKLLVTLLAVESDSLLLLRRPELRTLTGLLSGHCSFKYHIQKLGPAASNICILGKKIVESDCEAFCVIVKLLPRSGGITLAYNLEHAELSYISPKVVVA